MKKVVVLSVILIVILITAIVIIVNHNSDIIYEIYLSDGGTDGTVYNVKVDSKYNLKIKEKRTSSVQGRRSTTENKVITPSNNNKQELIEVLNNLNNELDESNKNNFWFGKVLDKKNNKTYGLELTSQDYAKLYFIINNIEIEPDSFE